MLARFVSLAAVAALLVSTSAHAVDPAVKCETSKLKEVAKYASCRLKAEAKGLQTNTTPDFSNCEGKFTPKFESLDTKFGVNVCPTENDEASINARITSDANDVAVLLSGGSVPSCGDGVAEGDESCDGVDLGGADCASLGFASGTLGCTAGCGYDVSGCAGNPPSTCGNGVIDAGEECDFEPGGVGGETCLSQGQLLGGFLHCGADCQFDYSGCNGFKRVFLTSTSYSGNLGGAAGADAICQARANFAGLPGTFKAWISAGNTIVFTDPATTFTHSTTPYIRVDGVVVADDWADLTDGTLDAPINVDEFGAAITSAGVMTSTYADGTAIVIAVLGGVVDCNDWTDGTAAGEGFQIGFPGLTDSQWTYATENPSCFPNNLHLYCFGQ